MKADGSVVTWGNFNPPWIPRMLEFEGEVLVDISDTFEAFCAVKSDGSVVAWGECNTGGNSEKVQEAPKQRAIQCM